MALAAVVLAEKQDMESAEQFYRINGFYPSYYYDLYRSGFYYPYYPAVYPASTVNGRYWPVVADRAYY